MRNIRKKGISPVIATVILVAIAIVVSIATAFWMTGLLTSFTSYEKIEIRYIYASRDGNTYTITLTVANTGSAVATIQELRINDKKTDEYTQITSISFDPSGSIPYTLQPGSEVTITIIANKAAPFTPGVSIKVSVITSVASYDKAVTLP